MTLQNYYYYYYFHTVMAKLVGEFWNKIAVSSAFHMTEQNIRWSNIAVNLIQAKEVVLVRQRQQIQVFAFLLKFEFIIKMKKTHKFSYFELSHAFSDPFLYAIKRNSEKMWREYRDKFHSTTFVFCLLYCCWSVQLYCT